MPSKSHMPNWEEPHFRKQNTSHNKHTFLQSVKQPPLLFLFFEVPPELHWLVENKK
jgi:hypothetical protein